MTTVAITPNIEEMLSVAQSLTNTARNIRMALMGTRSLGILIPRFAGDLMVIFRNGSDIRDAIGAVCVALRVITDKYPLTDITINVTSRDIKVSGVSEDTQEAYHMMMALLGYPTDDMTTHIIECEEHIESQRQSVSIPGSKATVTLIYN